MHEAWLTLDDEQKDAYAMTLTDVVNSKYGSGSLGEFIDCVNATAAQRAEAYLRTLDLPEVNKPTCKVCQKRPCVEPFDHCGDGGCIPF